MHAEIRKTRDEIAQKRAALATLRSGNTRAPLGVALERVDQLVKAQADDAQPLLEVLMGELTLSGRSAPARLAESRDYRALESMLLVLLPGIAEALKDRVRAAYQNGDGGIAPEELPAQVAALQAEILALEVRDLALSEKHGVAPRADTDPRALLGIA